MARPLTATALAPLPEIRPGDDLAALIAAAHDEPAFAAGDIVVISHKVVSKAEGAMVAADRPDTRSWTLLPGLVLVTRLQVAPGKHTLTLAATGPGGTETREFTAELKSGGHSVLDVTTLR